MSNQRRETMRQQILDAAQQLAGERGLTGWSMRDLAASIGVRAPSLYVYFSGKHAIYDALYAQGHEALLEATADLVESPLDAVERLREGSRRFVAFAVADPARLQLLFLRVIPGFTPTPQSYAIAQRVVDRLAEALGAAGLGQEHRIDLWTATLTGLATQQVSNDPGGSRWVRLVDLAFDALLSLDVAPLEQPARTALALPSETGA